MNSRARALVAPIYLFACLILGGSAQGIWQNMILQLAGVAIIAWAAFDGSGERLSLASRQLLLIAIGFILLVALQTIPLPPSVWATLGPRAQVADGFRAIGLAVPNEPLSLTPSATLNSMLGAIPPIAIVCAMLRLRAYRPQWIGFALIAGAVAGIALGAMQAASFNAEISPWYLYAETNVGSAVGFFANVNHMATLLVVAIPFLAAIVAAGRTKNVQRYSAIVAISAGLALVIVVGIALNGSLAGYGLALPVIAASVIVILPPASRLRLWVVGAAALLFVAAVAALEITPIGSSRIGEHATTSVQSRAQIFSTTTRAAADFMPFGSGLGSFQAVYPLYERAEDVTTEYVVHAHNDYAEVALELGAGGVALVLLFLAWWAAAVWRAWRSAEAGPFARAGAIASAAMLVHSLVDFPLRTAAIAACFGACIALLADSRAAPPKEKAQLRRKRHVEFK
jgi:O-antigen ligase